VKIAVPKKVVPVVARPKPVQQVKPVSVKKPAPVVSPRVYTDNRIDAVLRKLKLASWIPSFHEHSIDLDSLMDLTEADLKELGLRIGERKRVLRYQKQNESVSTSTRSTPVVATPVVATPVVATAAVVSYPPRYPHHPNVMGRSGYHNGRGGFATPAMPISQPRKKRMTCPKGHVLVCRGKTNSGWACDARNERGGCAHGPHGFYQSRNWVDWRCSQCNYDLCGLCVKRRGG